MIPEYTWKVAVIMPRDQGLDDIDDYRDFEVIAVVMPNVTGIRNVPWQTYQTTVDSVESLSGYDVLALLPDRIEVTVESGAGEAFDIIRELVTSGALSSGNANALTSRLDAAIASFARGNATAAVNQLEAFLSQLDALVSTGRMSTTDADALRAIVNRIIAAAA